MGNCACYTKSLTVTLAMFLSFTGIRPMIARIAMVNLSAALGGTLLGIDHVGLAVRDLDEAIARWSKTFGLEVSHREINESQGIEEAMLDLADGTRLQLLAPLNSESTIAKFLERSGEGMQQLAFRVTDIEQAMANVLDAGMRLIYPESRIGTAGSLINFVHPKDVGGVLVELVQPVDH
jgi:methylmalonyl-CoA/ethylmalonyl-CoA epimerase